LKHRFSYNPISSTLSQRAKKTTKHCPAELQIVKKQYGLSLSDLLQMIKTGKINATNLGNQYGHANITIAKDSANESPIKQTNLLTRRCSFLLRSLSIWYIEKLAAVRSKTTYKKYASAIMGTNSCASNIIDKTQQLTNMAITASFSICSLQSLEI